MTLDAVLATLIADVPLREAITTGVITTQTTIWRALLAMSAQPVAMPVEGLKLCH